MASSDFKAVLQRLNAIKSGDNWIARCPAHDDKSPSLSIRLMENGKTLLHCYAGCEYREIVAAISTHAPASAPSPDANRLFDQTRALIPEFRILEMHESLSSEYRQLLIRERLLSEQVIARYMLGQKDFRVSIPILDESGKCVNVRLWLPPSHRKAETSKILHWGKGYGASRLFPFDQLKHNAPFVALVEGELDALALISAGIPAITSTEGATSWNDENSELLRKKKIVILMDNDKAGRTGADIRAKSLHTHGCNVRVAKWPKDRPEKHDVTDELLIHGLSSLESILADAKEFTPASDVVALSEIEPEDVSWLWYPYIPLGKVTMIEGDPGLGKSWATLAIAVAVSVGDGLPDLAPFPAGKALLFTAEDGLADTIKKRLDSIGGNHEKILAFTELVSFDQPGLARISEAVQEHKPSLIVVDPLVAYLGAKVDFHRANEIRPIMCALANMAEDHNCAILIVRHLTKSGTDKSIYRGMGSIDITAACRSVILAGCDPDDKEQRALVHIKSNLAQKGPSMGFTIKEGRFLWTGRSELTAEQLLQPEEGKKDESKVEGAVRFLSDHLSSGPKPSASVFALGIQAGIAKRTIDRARRLIGVRSYSVSTEEDGFKRKKWMMALAGDAAAIPQDQDCQSPHTETLAMSSTDGDLKSDSTDTQPGGSPCIEY